MPLQIAPFQLPNRPTLTPQNLAALPKMGPPDMVEANMKGIAGLGTAFEGAYARARERGAMDQLSEYYKTHPFAAAPGGAAGVPGVTGVSGNPMADQPAAGATAVSGTHTENGLKVYNGLVARGIEPHVAAGMAGNIYTESRFNTGGLGDRDKSGTPTAIGYAQWRGSRQKGLFAAAQARGTDWRDPEAQLDHIVGELKGDYAKVYQAAVASGNPGAAAAILARGYERPADWALRKTLGERTGMAQSLFALGQKGGAAPAAAAGPAPAPAAVGPTPNAPNAPVVGGGVSAPPPVGLPPPDPTPDNVANAKAIMQQPTSDPKLKAWATQVLRQQPGAAALVPTADQPAPGAQQAGIQLPNNTFVIPSTGEQVPAGSGPDRSNAGAPPPQQVVVGADGNPVVPPSPAVAPPPLPPPDPRRVAAQAAAANAPAPGAVPTGFRPSGGDSTYAATADYEGAVRAGLLPPPAGGVPAGPAPRAVQPGPAATGSVPALGAAVPPQGAPAGPPPGQDPRLPAAQAAGNARANEMVEGIAQELVKRGMDPKEARVRAAGATWDDKGFRLGPYPNPAAERALQAPAAAAAPAVAPGAGGGAVTTPAPAPAAAPGGGYAPAAVGGAPGTFRANEALAIAARGDPQVFAAMLRQYGGGGATGGEWSLEHDGQGNWMKLNKQTGEVVPLAASQGQQPEGDIILPPNDPRRTTQFAGQMPNDGRTYRAHKGARGWEITPLDEREAKTFEHENALAQGFEGNQTIKNFRALTDATGSLRTSFAEGTAAGDVNGVIQVLKAIDPTSTVTQTEYGTIQSTGGLPGFASGVVARLNGGAPLTDQMRADFINAAEAQWRVRWNQTKTIVDSTRNRAKANGLDPGGATNGFTDPAFPERAKAEQFPTRDPTSQARTRKSTTVTPDMPVVTTTNEGDKLPAGTRFRIQRKDGGYEVFESDGSGGGR